MKKLTLQRKHFYVGFFILLIALTFRLYKINTPLADWHSWRQVDTAAVARNFVKDGYDLLHPRYDDLSSTQTGTYNPEGLRLVEFPIYNATFAALSSISPYIELHVYGRIVSIIMSLITLSVCMYILFKEVSGRSAFWAGIIFATFPFYVYYSRVVLPEVSAIGTVFAALFFLYVWKDSKGKKAFLYITLSCILAALSILIKPTAGFYYFALVYILFQKDSFKMFLKPHTYLYFILAVLPFFAWRYWIMQFDVGTPPMGWLITSVNTFEGQVRIFMRPAFFRWIFYERILLLISGGWAALFLVLGVMKKYTTSLLVPILSLCALMYLMVFQGGNVQHDYYQIVILPALAILTGVGIDLIFVMKKELIHTSLLTLLIIGILGFSWLLSYDKVKYYFGYSESLQNTARIIDELTPKDATVVTDTLGDTTLLYNANRRGMPTVSAPLPELKERGMQYFATDKDDVAAAVKEEYADEFELLFENEHISIFKL